MARIFGQHDENTIQQLRRVEQSAIRAALMADGHVGYVMPIGGVAAYRNKVSVVGVGFDIACGNAAIRTDLTVEQLSGLSVEELRRDPSRTWQNRRLGRIADEIRSTISFGIGRTNRADDAPVDDPLFESDAWSLVPHEHRGGLMEKARDQLGTVGSGNHYVDIFHDDDGVIWVGVHFGSRGFGHTVASSFLALSQGGRWGDRGSETEILLPLDAPLGHDYWHLMELAGRYAYVGREWVARKVVDLIGGTEQELVHNHHNFAWRETHEIDGVPTEVIVVRKGATPAFPGQKGFIGGSMADDAVIVRGAVPTDESDELLALQKEALFSTVHGAGRVMSRTAAAGRRNRRTGRVISEGRVTPEMMESRLRKKGVVLRGGGLDESPQVYRRLRDVLDAQGPTIEVLHTLHPLIVVMAGPDVRDPYRD
ncbi:MAG: RtcB family protein [Candidatus Cloacimonetes bacterium]|jgi:tRNA-splicing ligase RtcB|nr:RtcB family protein [Candidatus Cloacimonadota bacterium]